MASPQILLKALQRYFVLRARLPSTTATAASSNAPSTLDAALFTPDNFSITAVETHPTPSVTCSLTINPTHVNPGGFLHGGLICTLVDLVGTLAIATNVLAKYSPPSAFLDETQWPVIAKAVASKTGVSADLSVSFLRSGGRVGDRITIRGECLRMGRNLAFTQVVLNDAEGRMIATGTHTKYVGVNDDKGKAKL